MANSYFWAALANAVGQGQNQYLQTRQTMADIARQKQLDEQKRQQDVADEAYRQAQFGLEERQQTQLEKYQTGVLEGKGASPSARWADYLKALDSYMTLGPEARTAADPMMARIVSELGGSWTPPPAGATRIPSADVIARGQYGVLTSPKFGAAGTTEALGIGPQAAGLPAATGVQNLLGTTAGQPTLTQPTIPEQRAATAKEQGTRRLDITQFNNLTQERDRLRTGIQSAYQAGATDYDTLPDRERLWQIDQQIRGAEPGREQPMKGGWGRTPAIKPYQKETLADTNERLRQGNIRAEADMIRAQTAAAKAQTGATATGLRQATRTNLENLDSNLAKEAQLLYKESVTGGWKGIEPPPAARLKTIRVRLADIAAARKRLNRELARAGFRPKQPVVTPTTHKFTPWPDTGKVKLTNKLDQFTAAAIGKGRPDNEIYDLLVKKGRLSPKSANAKIAWLHRALGK